MNTQTFKSVRCSLAGLILVLGMVAILKGAAAERVEQQIERGPGGTSQADTGAAAASDTPDDPVLTMLPHSNTARYWVSGQDNIIFQADPSFYAKYSGPHSLSSRAHNAASNISTLFLGYQLRPTTEVFLHLEEASGGGLSDGLGLAGFSNLDVVRNPLLSKDPYVARVMIRQIIPLTTDKVEAERNPWGLATSLPARRLELRVGKVGMNDFLDATSVGTDSHFQFLNWTVDNNGAYDYSADTRGYTYGVVLSYYDRNWSFQFGEGLMPKVANGIDLVWNLRRARAENYELAVHPKLLGNRTTVVRLLSFVNHANMGVYKDAIDNYLAGKTPVPDITAHPLQTTIKYGFGVNLEHEFPHHFRAFSRWGWNEGRHESYAYTEVDETLQAGADLAGNAWHRQFDKVGAVFVTNGISAYHRKYLGLGGEGFLLGDGGLNYGRENIFETYYTTHVWRGFFTGPDVQHINNPGYNRDRAPVLVGR